MFLTNMTMAAQQVIILYLIVAVGFVADRFGDKTMIRVGYSLSVLGLVLMLLPVSSNYVSLFGLSSLWPN